VAVALLVLGKAVLQQAVPALQLLDILALSVVPAERFLHQAASHTTHLQLQAPTLPN
jgi:hypothetical protein